MTPTRIEPTEAMIEAGVKFAMNTTVHGKHSWRAYIADLWRHMRAASPPESVQASGAVTKAEIETALVDTWHKWGGWPAVESGMINMTGVMADSIIALYAAPPPKATP